MWERTPGSGALDPKHGLKGDVYVINANNLYCVEVKHYQIDHLTSKILTDKVPQFFIWWEQAVRQGEQTGKIPLLIFKFDRSKIFVAFQEPPSCEHIFISKNGYDVYIAILEEWYASEKPQFIK